MQKKTSILTASLGLIATILTGCNSSTPHTTTPDASIKINAKQTVAPVNAKIFGQFIKGADNYGIFSIPKPDISARNEGTGIWNPETDAPNEIPLKILKSYNPGAIRFPGGLSVHGYDWKQTIGPVEERSDWEFGLNEFMQVNEAIGSEVIFVVSEYIGTPQDAADLVEYLNMPAEEEYPWAMRRAADGHPSPYGVTYFEIGNESWVDWRKTGKPEVRTPNEVGRYASQVATAMKQVDPSIQCGIPYFESDTRWTQGTLSSITNAIDFVVIHTYPVKYGGRDMEGEKEEQILNAMLASGYATSLELKHSYETIHQLSGRSMPIAITEYNMGPTQQQADLKRPYRYTLAAAIGTGDYLGRLLGPDKDVITAIYWQWLNGFFEAVHTYSGHPWKSLEKLDQPKFRPVHYIFQLWSQYRGEYLLATEVKSPTSEFLGWDRMKPMVGTKQVLEAQLSEQNILENSRILPVKKTGISVEHRGVNEWTIHYDNLIGTDYSNLAIRTFNDLEPRLKPPSTGLIYKVSFEAKWEPQPGSSTPNMGLGLMDHRGYNKSGSAIAIRGLAGALEWTHFEADYQPREDTTGIVVLSRVEGGTLPVSGTLNVRNLKVEAWRGELYPERPLLSAYATRSADSDKVYLMVFNMSLDESLETSIEINGFQIGKASYTELNAGTAAATNDTESPTTWQQMDMPLKSSTDTLTHRFPPHSATGILLERK